MDRILYLDSRCSKCRGRYTFCFLIDINSNRHNRIWCEPCNTLYNKSVTKEMAALYGITGKDLPEYITKVARQRSEGLLVRPQRVEPPPIILKKKPKQVKQKPSVNNRPHILASRVHSPEKPDSQVVSVLRSMPYRDYLKSAHWKATRAAALCRAEFRCQLCYGRDNLAVHHRTYVRRGCEAPADLTVLCSPCHAKFHDILPKGQEDEVPTAPKEAEAGCGGEDHSPA